MAADDTLVFWFAQAAILTPTATRNATWDTFTDATTPALRHLVLDFDPGATTEFADFFGVMPGQYDGSAALEVILGWSTDATTGTESVKWDVAFKSITDDADDLDSKAFAAIQSTTDDIASAAGEVKYTQIAFTFAQADSVGPNEMFILRVERDSADAGDDMNSNDAELHFVELRVA